VLLHDNWIQKVTLNRLNYTRKEWKTGHRAIRKCTEKGRDRRPLVLVHENWIEEGDLKLTELYKKPKEWKTGHRAIRTCTAKARDREPKIHDWSLVIYGSNALEGCDLYRHKCTWGESQVSEDWPLRAWRRILLNISLLLYAYEETPRNIV